MSKGFFPALIRPFRRKLSWLARIATILAAKPVSCSLARMTMLQARRSSWKWHGPSP